MDGHLDLQLTKCLNAAGTLGGMDDVRILWQLRVWN